MKNEILELYVAVQSEGSRLKPTIVVRTSACSHRCYFGENNFCDSWYTSIHPEKSKFNILDVEKMYDQNPHIKELMLTGGSPTMRPKLVEDIMNLAYRRGIFVTIETEGSHFVKTTHPIDLISLSPKFSNSVPVLGVTTPLGKIVDEKMIKQHNKLRMNIDAMKQMIDYHSDYQIKPVWGGDQHTLDEIKLFLKALSIPNDKVYLMPSGSTREQLIKTYPIVMEKCIEEGWNFTGRAHIIAYGDKREV